MPKPIESTKSQIFFFILLIMLIFPKTILYSNAQGQSNLQIINVYLTPSQPIENENITIHALVNSVYPIKNVTLHWSNDSLKWYMIEMSNNGNSTFKGIIPAQKKGVIVKYYVMAFDTSNNSARWPNVGYDNFVVIARNDFFDTPINQSLSLRAGSNYLNVSKAKLRLSLNISSPIDIFITFADTSGLNRSTCVIHVYSYAVSIKVNNSEAIESVKLEFDLTRKIPHHFKDNTLIGYWRENNDTEWQEYPALIDIEQKTAFIITDHLSEWVIGETEPELELEVLPPQQAIEVNKEFQVNTTIINIGGGTLLNITITVYHVIEIIPTSGFKTAQLDALPGQESASIIWTFKAKALGVYNIIFVVTSEGGKSTSFTFKLTVTDSSSTSSSENITLNFNAYPVLFSFIFITLFLNILRRRVCNLNKILKN